MRRRGAWRLLALLSVFALFAAACSDDSDDGGEEGSTETTAGDSTSTTASAAAGASVDGVLTLGSLMPLTGDLQDYGPGMAAAIELAVEDANAAGGALGGDVVLVAEDSGSDPTIAGPATDTMVNTDNVDAIMGAAGSTVTLQGVLPTTTPAGRISCSGSATSPELSNYDDQGLFFRTAPSDAFQSQLLADTMAADGYTSVAIVNRADDYGQAFADQAEQYLTDAGAEVVASVAVDPEGTNFDADVEQVAAAAPDAALLILFPEEGATILSAMVEQGVGPADLPIFVTDGLASDQLGAAVDEADPTVVDGIVGTRPGAETPTDFNERLMAEKDVSEVTFAAQFYDCTIATILGAIAADTDDPVAIAEILPDITTGGTPCTTFEECAGLLADGEDIDYDGVTGFDWNDDGEVSSATYEVWSFEGGAITPSETVTIGGDEESEDTTSTTAG